jgi:hypothetical protein
VLVIVIVCLRLVGQVFERVYLGHPLFSKSGHIRLFGLEAVLQWDEFCACRWVSHMGLCVKHDSYVNITVFCVPVQLIGWAHAYQNTRLHIPEYYNQCIRPVRISYIGSLLC